MRVHRCGDLHIEYDNGGLMVRRPDGAQGQIELTWQEVHNLRVMLMNIIVSRFPTQGDVITVPLRKGEL